MGSPARSSQQELCSQCVHTLNALDQRVSVALPCTHDRAVPAPTSQQSPWSSCHAAAPQARPALHRPAPAAPDYCCGELLAAIRHWRAATGAARGAHPSIRNNVTVSGTRLDSARSMISTSTRLNSRILYTKRFTVKV